MAIKYTKEFIENLKIDYIDNNMSQSELAKKYNKSKGCIYAALRNYGIKKDPNVICENRYHSNTIYSDNEMIRRIKEDKKTMTVREIAEKYNLKKSTVRYILYNK